MESVPKRYRVPLVIAGAGVAALATGGIWLWIQRTPIATHYIDDMLAARHVAASYRITALGFRTERIEHIRIGDPADPDLVADWAEIRLSIGFGGVSLRAVDAGGVRLRGRLIDGRLSLGAIDRLLPKATGGAPSLPDIALATRDATVTIETPQGIVRANLTGAGGLADGFQGRLSLASDRITAGGCAVVAPRAVLTVAVAERRPSLKGPARAAAIDCAARHLHIVEPRMDVDGRSESDLARWQGALVLQRGALSGAGVTVANIGGRIDFDASSQVISGGGSLFADRAESAMARASRLAFDGDYRIDPRRGRAQVNGTASVKDGALAPGVAERRLRLGDGFGGTPLGPIATAWQGAVLRAGRAIDAQADISLAVGDGGALRIERLDASSASGARLLIRGERAEGLAIRWPAADVVLNGSAEFGGGGLPELRLSLRQATAGAALNGTASMRPYRAGAARLAFTPIRFSRVAGGSTAIETQIMADGPLADGRVDGLSVPVAILLARDGAMRINPSCARLTFDRLRLAGTVIAKAALPVCPRGGAIFGRSAKGAIFGGAVIAAPSLQGHVGSSPLSISARSIDMVVAKPGFSISRLAVRLGEAGAPTRFDADSLDGHVDASGMSGHTAGATGKIGAVPLVLSNGEGDWRLASGILTAHAGLRVADAETAAPRFLPMRSDNVVLTLANKRITATAILKEPASGRRAGGVTIHHDLASGRGDATLDVPDLTFDKGLQPEQLTPLTKGIIANVKGTVAGQGHIRWAGGNVTSDGLFHTDRTDLAAAFGPVKGIKGAIRFTDLLGLVSAPDQEVRIAELNPGIAVTDGVIRYRLLPDRKVAISGGAWPFSGGSLTLDPTTLDLGQPVARRLTFRLAGLDAATFLQQLEFKNLAVTGKFDGVLPIIFEGGSGRIEKGVLTVRRGGGTLAYVGDVTNADLGRFSRLAFDALKAMHYDRLTIELDGSLDAEIVSKVRFDGTNDAPVASASRKGLAGRLLAPLTGLPFRFTITITAPFRGLVNSAQTFVDPSILLKQAPTEPPVDTTAPIQPR
ncbi:Dicarboxylate transport [Sphingomonas sp. YR710]|nr:Dicarboxylate transport [Sphingomonas sp. YR710]